MTRLTLLLAALAFSLTGSLSLTGCAVSTHAAGPAALGVPRRAADLLAVIDQPGPIEVESVASADWAVTRAGLIDLDDPQARAAGLTDGDEPIQIYFHVLRHPEKGTYLVDTGVERALRDAPDKAALSGLAASYMKVDAMKFHAPLGEYLTAHPGPLAGVMLTHLHLDHIAGMPDVPRGTPIYTGPGEAAASSLMNAFARGPTDRALEGQAPLSEWAFRPDPDGRFAGVIDVFGDGSLWALHVPGHTPGSTAYLARTPKGPVLLVGDASHTAWGWSHGVGPGSFSADRATGLESLARLRRLAAEHPQMQVRLGHQPVEGMPVKAASR